MRRNRGPSAGECGEGGSILISIVTVDNRRTLNMETATLILNYIQVLVCHLVVVLSLIKYRKVL